MGYRGKLKEQEQARALRAQSWTLLEIAEELGVSKSSVSLWVRDVEFTPKPRKSGQRSRIPGNHPWHQRKLDEIARLDQAGVERIDVMSEREFLFVGLALYAGEGSKRDGEVSFANSDPKMIAFFCRWLRHFFEIDESRLRLAIYLHAGLDIEETNQFWAEITDIPIARFGKPYRAVPDAGIRNTKHRHGCPRVRYCSTRIHREIMGLIRAMLEADFRCASD